MAGIRSSYGVYLLGLVLVMAALIPNLLIHNAYGSKSLFFLFVIGTTLVAVAGGTWPALFTAGLASAAVLFFFVEPLYTFGVHHEREWGRLLLFAIHAVPAILGARIGYQLAKRGPGDSDGGDRDTAWRSNGQRRA